MINSSLVPEGVTSGVVCIDLAQLRSGVSRPARRLEKTCLKPWPIWARLVRSRRIAGDRGVGDTVERTVGIFGSEAFRFWHYCVFGGRKPCPACPSKWNRVYAYTD